MKNKLAIPVALLFLSFAAFAQDRNYPILDSHLHYTDFLQKTDGFPSLTAAMDAANVTEAIVFGMGISKQWDGVNDNKPGYYLSDDCRCYYYSATDYILAEELLAQPENVRKRFFPFICGVNPNDLYSVEHIKRLLDLYPGFWCGIGEIMSRHDDLTALTYGEPPHINSKGFKLIFDLAAERGLPVLVHHNITAQSCDEIKYVSELEEALAHNRNCNIIWAHIGISRRVEIQGLIRTADILLKENPNLFIDISWLVYDYYFLNDFPTGYKTSDTLDDWVRFIEKYPTRILIGTDKVGHWNGYQGEITKYYRLLDLLKPETVRRICRDNALALIKRQ